MAKSAQPRYLDGKALRLARANAGLEQAELAEKVGVNQGQVSDWERGYNGCRLGMLHKLAGALGCMPADLMIRHPGESDGGDAEQEPAA